MLSAKMLETVLVVIGIKFARCTLDEFFRDQRMSGMSDLKVIVKYEGDQFAIVYHAHDYAIYRGLFCDRTGVGI